MTNASTAKNRPQDAAVILTHPRANRPKVKNPQVSGIADGVLTIAAVRKRIIDEYEAERRAAEKARRVDEIREEMAFLCVKVALKFGLPNRWTLDVIDFAASQGAFHE